MNTPAARLIGAARPSIHPPFSHTMKVGVVARTARGSMKRSSVRSLDASGRGGRVSCDGTVTFVEPRRLSVDKQIRRRHISRRWHLPLRADDETRRLHESP